MFLELFAFVISRVTFAKVENVVHELMLIEGNYFSYLFERRQTVNSLPLYLLKNEYEFNSTFAATEICDNVSNDW